MPQFSSVQLLSRVTPWTAARQASLSITNSRSLPELMSIESVIPSSHLSILTAESEEELKSFLMTVKEESEKVGLMLNIQKTNIMASGPITSWQIPGGSEDKKSACNAGDRSLIPGEGNGYPLQYSCQGKPMNRGVWWAIAHRVTK